MNCINQWQALFLSDLLGIQTKFIGNVVASVKEPKKILGSRKLKRPYPEIDIWGLQVHRESLKSTGVD